MRDFMTVKVIGSPKLIFNDGAGADSLYVTVAATHSGVVNGNMRFYRPDCMQATSHLWVPDGRANLPVLLRHDKNCDPVGRVMKARYVDLSYKYGNPELRQTMFYDGKRGRKNLFESVDWVVRNLQCKDDYEGLGYVELGLKITDPTTIGKVQRDEYMTVSVGFDTDQASCSVCHTDWAREDRCEHKLGRMYDGKRCFLITGRHTWEEVSWVTFPADPYAAVITKKAAVDALADSLATRAFYLGLPQKEREMLIMADSLEDREFVLESDIEPVETGEDEMDWNVIAKEVKADGLTRERALELIALLEAFTGEDANEKRRATRTLNTLKATVKTKGWEEANTAAAPTKDQVEAKIAGLDELLKTLSPEAQEAYISRLADEAAAFGLEFTPPNLDAVEEPATGEVKDAQTKEPVLEPPVCTLTFEGLNATDAEKLAAQDAASGKKILAAVEQVDSVYNGLDPKGDEKYLFRSCLSTLMEKWSTDGYLSYLKSKLESTDETIVSKHELDTLHDAVGKYESDTKSLQDDNKALLETNKALIGKQKKYLATVIVALDLASGNTTYQGLDASQIQAEIERKSKRHLISLQDAVEDLLDRIPTFKQAAPETKTSTEVAKEINDGAAANTTEKPETDSKSTGETPSGHGTVQQPVITLSDLRHVQKSQAVAQYRELKNKIKK